MTNCPVFKSANLIGKKWTIFILGELASFENKELMKNKGFNKLLNKLKKIRPKYLSKRLKDLESIGIIKKETSYSPLRTSYCLTEKGRELNNILSQLKSWNVKHSSELQCDKINCSDCKLF